MNYFSISAYDDQFQMALTAKIECFDTVVYSPSILDTGASFSMLSATRSFQDKNVYRYKKRAITEKREFMFGMGIGSYEDYKDLEYRYMNYRNGLLKDSKLFDDIIECNSALFLYDISDVRLSGVQLDCDHIWVNFDYKYDSLIGMDILSKFDIHMGISVCDIPFEVNKGVFSIVASKDPYDKEYLSVLHKVFNKTDSSMHLSEELNNAFSRIVNR